ncbi:hypothetical protein [[Haemophilus] ducreyi]|uniref:hypothetical protein n=1 Tax=Haemophilus ducreyi TaxID=730 RepID=UPI000656063E|nr:hypothetical protein [[Haemophilus] ducreyi]AKO45638.1 hypothetical protein RZ66_05255 [[Haemophilus] ducreyi]AKO47023.1 hypothetical protein RZ67_05170 [[Haemophilus] ducreyi]AKO48369.1 hypothetical protein RZ68_05155 [[Haemophilus] ducreyi]AKO49754.1 hypothetical protein RZ69_05195 [[Haemophilus] ducreyi]ANF61364.1 hypothetical protein A6037_00535 [[Haemophilus] ducreyi]
MADIILKDITPRHFYETVKLLKTTDYHIYITLNTLEIRFSYNHFETADITQMRFEQLEHVRDFLQQLVHSSVPIDLDEFLNAYRYTPRHKSYKRK